jgi:hypothetical protein
MLDPFYFVHHAMRLMIVTPTNTTAPRRIK